MHRFWLRTVLSGCLLGWIAPGTLESTYAAAPSGLHVTGCSGYILTVGDLDRSLHFYRDVIGLEVSRAPGPPSALPMMQRLTDTPGALWRSSTLRLPGTRSELVLMEFTGMPRRTLRPRAVDPGAVSLVLGVHELDSILAAARSAKVVTVTRGRAPIGGPHPGARAIVLLDPDGFYVQLSEAIAPPTPVAPGNVLTARMLYTAADSGTVVRFYRDVLGLEVTPGTFASSPTLDALFDVPGAQSDSIRATAPNDRGVLEFIVFKGVARHTYRGRPQDPGTPSIALTVNDLTAALRRMRSAGATVVTSGGEPISSTRTAPAVFLHDPAGMLLELIQER